MTFPSQLASSLIKNISSCQRTKIMNIVIVSTVSNLIEEPNAVVTIDTYCCATYYLTFCQHQINICQTEDWEIGITEVTLFATGCSMTLIQVGEFRESISISECTNIGNIV